MTNGERIISARIVIVLLALASARLLNADPAPVEVTVTANPTNGGYQYDYRVKNTGAKTIFSFMVGTPGSGAITPQIKECWAPAVWKGQIMLLPKLGFAATWVYVANQNSG